MSLFSSNAKYNSDLFDTKFSCWSVFRSDCVWSCEGHRDEADPRGQFDESKCTSQMHYTMITFIPQYLTTLDSDWSDGGDFTVSQISQVYMNRHVLICHCFYSNSLFTRTCTANVPPKQNGEICCYGDVFCKETVI